MDFPFKEDLPRYFFCDDLFFELVYGNPLHRIDNLVKLLQRLAARVKSHTGRDAGADDLLPALIWAIVTKKDEKTPLSLPQICSLLSTGNVQGFRSYALAQFEQA